MFSSKTPDRMKLAKESFRLFMVYMSFVGFVATVSVVIYFAFKVIK